MEIFVKRINELLKDSKKTIYEFAKELGITKSLAYYWFEGKVEPKITHLKKIADYFGVCADYLLGRQEYY